jgi:hypothetical protein
LLPDRTLRQFGVLLAELPESLRRNLSLFLPSGARREQIPDVGQGGEL